jgi:translation initiation factor 3 subunit F
LPLFLPHARLGPAADAPPPSPLPRRPQSGARKGDPALGRYLADTLAAVPHLQPEAFDALFNESVQDVLLVTYLSNLVRAQVALAEKLGTSQLPVL